jgi:hypothetical protein
MGGKAKMKSICLSLSVLLGSMSGAAFAQEIPRTPWGDPDLQGTYTTDNWIASP